MDARTLAALRASIAHWQRNVAAETPYDVRIGADACALCDKFFRWDDCAGCPVSQRSGRPRCQNTPYAHAHAALVMWDLNEDDPAARDAWRAAAQAMLDFLRGLLPEGET